MSCGASVIRLERYRYERSVIHACIHYCTRVYTRVYTRVHYPEHTECLVGLSVSGRVGKSLGRWCSECTLCGTAKYMGGRCPRYALCEACGESSMGGLRVGLFVGRADGRGEEVFGGGCSLSREEVRIGAGRRLVLGGISARGISAGGEGGEGGEEVVRCSPPWRHWVKRSGGAIFVRTEGDCSESQMPSPEVTRPLI